MSTIQQLLEQRASTNHYDSSRGIGTAEIRELVRLATLAPSAYNFQNWKFIAVQSPEGKERLKTAAYGQHKVVEAAVTFIVCGTLNAHRGLAAALQPAVDAGMISHALVEGWITAASNGHEGKPTVQRDEAFRSASLAAMTLMLAAEGMGLKSGPMGGFNPQAVREAFALGEDDVPVILVTVGYPATNNWAQKPRRAVADVLTII